MTASLPSGVPASSSASCFAAYAAIAGQPAGERERVGVGDLDDPVRDVAVVALGPEVLADALDEVGAAGAPGVHGPGRVGADHLDVGVLLLEVAADAADRAAGAHARDEVGDPPLRLAPDLRP